ncbi:MAG: hypothetical protein KatS3mg108_2013 [Isosphaeraceae bacterium]|nr:MAG: hypothetical protein KatS3mg108_2013 [Isosphaeraceae bacterium]
MVVAVGWHVVSIGSQLQARGESVEIDAGWAVGSALAYVGGLIGAGFWFHRVMAASPTPIGAGAAVRAYVISHLGKYVPGKAMVVVIRAGLACKAGARPAAAVFGTLYETLVMMASGAVVALIGFALSPAREVRLGLGPLGEQPVSLLGLSAALAALFLGVTAPPVFPRLAGLASATLRGAGSGAWPRLSSQLLGVGLIWNAGVWLLMGVSQYAALRALGVSALGWEQMPAIVAAVALATVAGFVVAVAPGGLGVREWVLWTSLGVVLDHERAVLAALLLRLTWLIGELAAAVACGVLGWRSGRSRGVETGRLTIPSPPESP